MFSNHVQTRIDTGGFEVMVRALLDSGWERQGQTFTFQDASITFESLAMHYKRAPKEVVAELVKVLADGLTKHAEIDRAEFSKAIEEAHA